MSVILPEGISPLQRPKDPATKSSAAYQEVKLGLQEGTISQDEALELMNALPSETLRLLVQKIAGTDASFLMTFTRQVQLVEAVLNQLVYPDGRLKPGAIDADISLKDALTMSARVTQMMLRDLPKLYTVDRTQRYEQAIGDVMEKYFDRAQQDEVLQRLQDLTGE